MFNTQSGGLLQLTIDLEFIPLEVDTSLSVESSTPYMYKRRVKLGDQIIGLTGPAFDRTYPKDLTNGQS